MEKTKKRIKKIKDGYLKLVIKEVRWIYGAIKVHKNKMMIYIVMNFISMIIASYFSFQISSLIDSAIEQNWNHIFRLGIMYLLIGAFNIIMSVISQRIGAQIRYASKRDITYHLYQKVMRADWETVNKIHSGDILLRIQEDAGYVSECTVGWIPSLFVQVTKTLISIAVIAYYDFSMILVIVLIAPPILLISRAFIGKIYTNNKEQRKAASELNVLYKDSFQNIQTIKAFGLFEYFDRKIKNQQQKTYDLDMKVNKYSVLSWSVMYVSTQVAAVICLAWAIYHVYTGRLSLGAVASMFVFASYILSGVKSMIGIIPNIVQTVTAAGRIRELMSMKEENIYSYQVDRVIENGFKSGVELHVSDISFAYQNGKNIFENSSFDVDSGSIVALVGPSGEGKTTILRIILGLVKLKQGDIWFQVSGSNEKIFASAGTRKMIAYVPQGNTIMHGSIADNMRMVKENATDEEIVAALKQACAYEFVNRLPDGIYHSIGESGIGFSEGQNQRLAIARALLCESPILLLDEATSALDVVTERKVLRNIMDASQNKTCILTTHRPSVLTICDRVYRISDATIKQIGDKEIMELINEF